MANTNQKTNAKITYTQRVIAPHKEQILNILNKHTRAVVFDVETTGLPGKNGLTESTVEIIQLSAMLIDISSNGKTTELETFDTYIKPRNELTEEVSNLTGITQENLTFAPTEEQAVDKILQFVRKADLWIGYNIPFDIARLKWLCIRCGKFAEWQSIDPNQKEGVNVIDVLPMARNFINEKAIEAYKKKNGITKRGKYKLEFVLPLLRKDVSLQFHDSMEDVRATALVFEALLPVYKNYSITFGTEKPEISMVRFTVNPHQVRNSRKICVYTPSKSEDGALANKLPIFWDLSKSSWTCKADTKSKKQFLSIDIAYVEKTVLDIALTNGEYELGEFETPNMDSLAIQMEKRYMASKQGKWVQEQAKEITKKNSQDQSRKEVFV